MSEEKSGGGISLATKSRFRTPKNFFPVVVDDFFSDPEDIVDYGKSLPKESNPENHWPGKRSINLWDINKNLAEVILFKIISCYYDLDYIDIFWNESQIAFHEISRFSENKNDRRNKGWIHQDVPSKAYPSKYELAGLIYLTPNIDPDSGTSLYNLKSKFNNKQEERKIGMSTKRGIYKQALFKQGNFDVEEYIMTHMKHEENFSEKVRFQNIFNRLIMYDTCEWHGANSYYNADGEDARLTLGFFVGGISLSPLKKVKSSEYESIIKEQIGKNENK